MQGGIQFADSNTLLFDEAKRPRCSVDLVNMYGKTAKDYAIESGHAIKIVPLLEAGVGDQKAALETILESQKKPEKRHLILKNLWKI